MKGVNGMDNLLFVLMFSLDALLCLSVVWLVLKYKKLRNFTINSFAVIKTNNQDNMRAVEETAEDLRKLI